MNNNDYKGYQTKHSNYHNEPNTQKEVSLPNITPDKYFDEHNNVRPSLFVDDAENTAKSFRNSLNNERPMKGSQVRKFYDEVLRLKLQIQSSENEEEKFKKVLPYIKMIIPKAVYSKAKNNANTNFERFIKDNIGNINNIEQFEVFCDFFEAVVAYCKVYLREN